MIRTLLAVALVVGFVAPAAAGPISVFTQVREVNNGGSDECASPAWEAGPCSPPAAA